LGARYVLDHTILSGCVDGGVGGGIGYPVYQQPQRFDNVRYSMDSTHPVSRHHAPVGVF
jgi:hypothetical protein